MTSLLLEQLTATDLRFNIDRLLRRTPKKAAAEILQLSALLDVVQALGARTVGDAIAHPAFATESRARGLRVDRGGAR